MPTNFMQKNHFLAFMHPHFMQKNHFLAFMPLTSCKKINGQFGQPLSGWPLKMKNEKTMGNLGSN